MMIVYIKMTGLEFFTNGIILGWGKFSRIHPKISPIVLFTAFRLELLYVFFHKMTGVKFVFEYKN